MVCWNRRPCLPWGFAFLLLLAGPLPVAPAEELRDFQRAEEQTRVVLPKLLAATVGIHLDDSTGSGVIVREDGLLVSAAHVLMRPGTEFDVELHDGRTLKAKALGLDHDTDVGLAQIAVAGKYPFLPLAQPKAVRPRDWCLATGHPEGIFAARKPPLRLGRVLELGDYHLPGEGIVTDAPVFPGDSGGPLCNLAGEVVGIHSSIGVYLTENIHSPVDALHDRWEDLLAGQEFGTPVAVEGGGLEEFAWQFAPDALVGLIDAVATWFGEEPAWFEHAKDGEGTLLALEPATLGLRRSLVDVHVGGQPAAIGLLVGEGQVLTKASELPRGAEILCLLGERERPAEVLARDRRRDLALLRLGGKPLKNARPVKLPAAEAPPPGSWLVTPDVDGAAYSLGIVSNAAAQVRRPRKPHGALRIEIDEAAGGGPRVARVLLGGPAQRAGIRVGDVIEAVDAAPQATADELLSTIDRSRPGQELWLTIRRGAERLNYSVILAEASSEDDDFHGLVSRRRGGFPLAFAHDSGVAPEACGGPLVNLRGEIVGWNIARAGRFTTLALPLSEVRQSLDELLAEVAKQPTKQAAKKSAAQAEQPQPPAPATPPPAGQE